MKKSLLLAGLVAAGFAASSSAAHISPEQALQRINSSVSLRAVSGKFKDTPKYHATIGNLYVFKSSKGYMILPDNDEAPAMLAYSENGDFSEKGNPGLEYWLDYYNRELNYLNNHSNSHKAMGKAATRPERSPIAPMTKTRWNQSAPYNDMCPMDGNARSV
ncbi:MAG: C10 family peptidase, partial [Muribaculaceae bacterium]|nr:C10 family peptidase [Muribaculaceae bacterium]